MRILLIIFFVSFAWSSAGQDLYVISLRDQWFDTKLLNSGNEWQIAHFAESEIKKANTCCLSSSKSCFGEMKAEELLQTIEHKRVLVLIHGMAKSWGAANKDFFNMYWQS
ncbi:MAG: hypothetical protein HKN32_09230, partial [Flavobacteriales bacterium]|nr:hypothetical protein [Flavobacteriales bacterium]